MYNIHRHGGWGHVYVKFHDHVGMLDGQNLEILNKFFNELVLCK